MFPRDPLLSVIVPTPPLNTRRQNLLSQRTIPLSTRSKNLLYLLLVRQPLPKQAGSVLGGDFVSKKTKD
jgi:hypothetical protein